MGTSVLHIKTEVECRVYLFDEEKGIAKPGTYFNLEVRKGEQDLLFVSTKNECVRCQLLYAVEENGSDYRMTIERSQFKQYTQELIEDIRLAEQGDAEAQFRLGKYHYEEQDYAVAVKWYRKAAEQSHVNAQNNLGECYHYGLGVELDFEEAEKWYKKAAKQGNAAAQINLVKHFYYGEGVDQYFEDVVKWYRKAAEQGNAQAQCDLGWCYKIGQGVEQNSEEAVKWYRKAADLGYDYAQFMLGECYEDGEGVDQDLEKALKWYRKAAEQGNDFAHCNLNRLVNNYLFFDTETTGVPRDYKAPASNTRNWPRLVQLGWIVTDEEGNVLSQGNEIVKPEGFVIPADAARVHGITTERAQREGKPLREVIEAFLKDAEQTKCIVGHNISFDQKVVGSELYRLGIPDTISTAKSLCTMQAGTDYCKIPSYYGYKWPKLQELHHKLFGCDFEDAHDAMADITATKKCFFEMRKRGLI